MRLIHLFKKKSLVQKYLLYIGLLLLVFLPFLFQPDATRQEFNIVFAVVIINIGILLLLLVCAANRKYAFSLIDFAICLSLLYSMISIFSVDALHLHKLILFVCIYLLAKAVVSSGYEHLILYTVIMGGLLQSGFGLLQWADIYVSNHRAFVATGSFANPGPFGGYIGVALSASVGMLFNLKGRGRAERICLCLSILVLGTACFISDSRAAWMSVIIAVISMVVWKCKLVKKKYWIVGMLVFLSIVLFLFYFYRPVSADARILIWKVCGMMVQEEPLLGTGVGTFPSIYMHHQAIYLQQLSSSAEELIVGDNIYAFNEFIKVLCEQGMVGFILFLFILFAAFRVCFYPPNDNRMLLLYPLIAYLTFSFFSYPFDVLPLYLLFPLLLGGISGSSDKKIGCAMVFNKWIKLSCISLLFAIGIGSCRDWLFKNEVKRQLTSYFFKDDKKSAVYLQNTFSDYRMCLELVLQYSSALYLKGEYADAIRPLKQVMALSPSSVIACDLGSCCQQMEDYEEAELYYTLASSMVPGLITPKYLLFSMCVETEQQEKAQELAKEIVAMPVKQISERTETIKLEAGDYLKKLE